MPIEIKSSLVSVGTVVSVPSTVTGDLIVIFLGSYNTDPSVPAGYTLIGQGGMTATYTNYWKACYKIATSQEASSYSVGGNNNYSTHICIVITGHSPTNPIQTFHQNSSNGNATLTFPSISITSRSKELIFGCEMNNSGNVPNFTTPSGTSLVATNSLGQPSNYYRGAVYTKSNIIQNETVPSLSLSSDQSGAFGGFRVWVNEGNSTPQVQSQYPENYDASGPVTSPVTLGWTYSDTESNTQYKYEISYREAGTTGAYTTVTSANAVTATSHTFASNTFVDGREYEWRLRLDDNQGGGWSPYYTAYFTAGPGKWIYGPQITSSSSTSATTTRVFANYDFESGVQGWQNNPFFGTYADCTFTNSTTRPKTGTRSMEITWPTTTGQTRLASPSISGFKIGSTYRIEADVYVPAGSPIVRLDPFLQTGGKGGVMLDKDSWVTAWCEFQAVNESITFAVVAEATTSGQKVFMDNFRVIALTPEPGNYQLSVRTSDGVGYGAWSAPSNTFAVRSGPVAEYLSLTPQRVGSNITVNWKYRDVDSQAQTKYKIRYRKK